MAGRVKHLTAVTATAIAAGFVAALSACSPIDDPSLHPEFDPAKAAKAPPIIVAAMSHHPGMPPWATIMVGTVVISSWTMIFGFVSAA